MADPTIADLQTSIDNLTTQTTALLDAVNLRKSQLDTSVAAADSSEAAALTYKDLAEAARTAALAAQGAAELARTGAETAEDNAVAVTTGGTATLTPEAGKIPIAGAEPYIDAGWLQATTAQVDVGTAPDQVPLNQHLGPLAYQDIPYVADARKPVVPLTTPTVQNVIDALLALGLVKQED